MAGRCGRCETRHRGGDEKREGDGMDGICVDGWVGGSVRVGVVGCW